MSVFILQIQYMKRHLVRYVTQFLNGDEVCSVLENYEHAGGRVLIRNERFVRDIGVQGFMATSKYSYFRQNNCGN